MKQTQISTRSEGTGQEANPDDGKASDSSANKTPAKVYCPPEAKVMLSQTEGVGASTIQADVIGCAPGATATLLIARQGAPAFESLWSKTVHSDPGTATSLAEAGTMSTSIIVPAMKGVFEIRLYEGSDFQSPRAVSLLSVTENPMANAALGPPQASICDRTAITLGKLSFAKGENLKIGINNLPKEATDAWVALAPVGSGRGSNVAVQYVSAWQANHTEAGSKVEMTLIPLPDDGKPYEVRLFCSASFDEFVSAREVPRGIATGIDMAPKPIPGLSCSDVKMTVTPADGSGAPTKVHLTRAPLLNSYGWVALSAKTHDVLTYYTAKSVLTGAANPGDDRGDVDLEFPGYYAQGAQIRYFCSSGNRELAQVQDFTAAAPFTSATPTPTPQPPPTITPGTACQDMTVTLNKASYTPGDRLVISTSAFPANSWAMVALARPNEPARSYLNYTWLFQGTRSKTPSSSEPSVVSMRIPTSAQVGSALEVRLFCDSGFTKLAKTVSVPITSDGPYDGPGAAPCSASSIAFAKTTWFSDEAVNAEFRNVPVNERNAWVSYVKLPADNRTSSGEAFAAQLVSANSERATFVYRPGTISSPGKYAARLYCDGSFESIAKEEVFYIETPPPPVLASGTDCDGLQVSPRKASARPNEMLSIEITRIPKTVQSLTMRLSRVGSPRSSFENTTANFTRDDMVDVGSGYEGIKYLSLSSPPGQYELRTFCGTSSTDLVALNYLVIEGAAIDVVKNPRQGGSDPSCKSATLSLGGQSSLQPYSPWNLTVSANESLPPQTVISFTKARSGLRPIYSRYAKLLEKKVGSPNTLLWSSTNSLEPGDWEVRLHCLDDLEKVANVLPVKVDFSASEAAQMASCNSTTLSTEFGSYRAGERIGVVAFNAPLKLGGSLLLVNLDTLSQERSYFSNLNPNNSLSKGLVADGFHPTLPGRYELRLLCFSANYSAVKYIPLTITTAP